MKNLFVFSAVLISWLTLTPLASGQDPSVQELQSKLDAAQREIESLKDLIRKMQVETDTARAKGLLPAVRSMQETMSAEFPVVTAYELASYAKTNPEELQQALAKKIVSVSGKVDRFTEGFGTKFKVYLDTEGTGVRVSGAFDAGSYATAVHTEDDGAQMIIEHSRKGRIVAATIDENVVISGLLAKIKPNEVALKYSVLGRQ